MRREGFELCVGRPRVLFQTDPETGERLEPIEEVVVDVDEEYSGVVVEKLTARRAELKDMRPAGAGKQRIVFHAPSRALIGYLGEFLTDTRGTGVLNRVFAAYEPFKGAIEQRHTGVLVSSELGESAAYALWNLEDRGPLFIGAGEKIYPGMIIGEHTRGNDLDVNPLRAKKLTNIRAAGKDDNLLLTPPVRMTLETVDRLRRRRRAGRGHAQGDPAPQAPPRRQRPQADGAAEGSRLTGAPTSHTMARLQP